MNFVVDTTGSRPNVMVKVEPKNNGKIKVIVKNFNGKYDATLRTNQQLNTIGDVNELFLVFSIQFLFCFLFNFCFF